MKTIDTRKNIFFEKVKKGDIIATKTENWIGRIIRWVTSSNYNHIAIYIGDGKIIESQDGYGVRLHSVEQYLDHSSIEVFIFRSRRLSEKKADKMIEISKEFINEKYDLWGLIGILTKYLVKKVHLQDWITFWGENKIAHPRYFWCSEFVAHCFALVGITFVQFDATYIAPHEICDSQETVKINY